MCCYRYWERARQTYIIVQLSGNTMSLSFQDMLLQSSLKQEVKHHRFCKPNEYNFQTNCIHMASEMHKTKKKCRGKNITLHKPGKMHGRDGQQMLNSSYISQEVTVMPNSGLPGRPCKYATLIHIQTKPAIVGRELVGRTLPTLRALPNRPTKISRANNKVYNT